MSILPCFLATCAILCFSQISDGVHGHVFRSDALGLTYTFQETFAAQGEDQAAKQNSKEREHMVLSLWSTADRSGPPRMSFLHDRKTRPAALSRAEIANHYLAAVRQLWAGVRGGKMLGPQKIVFPHCDAWRLDLFQPDALPHYNAAVVIPMPDRSILAIQINAPSQAEVDKEVDSLRELRLDARQP